VKPVLILGVGIAVGGALIVAGAYWWVSAGLDRIRW
jgi:hypothetical protein